MNNNEVWQAVLAELELNISKANFVTWFKNTTIVSSQQGQIILCIPNAFTKAWLEKKYHASIIRSIERVTGKPVRKLEYKIDNIKNALQQATSETVTTPTPEAAPAPVSAPASLPFSVKKIEGGVFSLNPRCIFDTFVVGKNSELAHAAARAVADRPGTAYNPLFIYGGVGLGKTHLLQAVGNDLLKSNPSTSILYVSAEKFSTDYINSIKDRTVKDFQKRYRSIDLLLIDDIQFIAGKEGTQEAFFHTFNELHQQNKQVVITSDRPPKAIPALEDRLRSRFEWGMIADISAPDFETRLAILQRKCAEKSFPLAEKALQFIAANVQSNIRELEGVLNKIIVFHQLKNTPPTLESIKALIGAPGGGSGRQNLTPNQLIDTVCQFYNLTREEIVGKNREKKISVPRQIIMFLMREEMKMSFPAIGEELGGRDHTTAMHAVEKINNELVNDLRIKQELEMLRQRLYVNNV